MHIQLGRTFRELLIKDPADDTQALYSGSAILHLPVLLEELRVVILSEGGSGKTEEIQQASRQLREQGKAAFFMRLEHVAHDFDSAFVEGDFAEFEKWLASPEPGWMLLDSVDESRLRSALDFELAIRKVAARISKAKQRTHLLITGRAAAWRPKSDLDLCNSLFPVANEVTAGHEDAEGGQTTERTKPDKSPFKIVTLQDLSPEQIEIFAGAKGIADTKKFLDDIDRADAWSFTVRPQDLIEVTEYWQDNGRIGSRLELMQNSVKRRLQETSQDRIEARALSDDQALEGAQLIAGAMMLTQVQNIRVPDAGKGVQGLDVRDLFKGWQPADLGALLQRPLFGQDIYSTVRFHHRSVKEYLAAQWFLKLLGQEVSRRKVEELFFRDQYGLEVVVPSLRPLLPWMSMGDSRILEKVRRLAPEIVFEGGDPVQLPVDVRREILEQVCKQLSSGASRRSMADFAAIQRFAAPDLIATVRRLAKKHADNDDIASFLMRMVWQGRLADALPEVMSVARSPTAGQYARIAAFRAVAELGTPKDMVSIRNAFANEGDQLNRKCMAELVSHITRPDAQTLAWLLECIPQLVEYDQYEGTGLSEQLSEFFERADIAIVASAIVPLQALLAKQPVIERSYCEISKRYQWLRQCAGVAVRRLINARDPAALTRSALSVLHVLPMDGHYNIRAFDVKKLGLAELVQRWPELNWALFWHVIAQVRKTKQKKGERVVDAWMALAVQTYVHFELHHFDEAVRTVTQRLLADDREVGLTLAHRLYLQTDKQNERLAQLKAAVAADATLKARLAGLLKPPRRDTAWKRMELENRRWSRKAEAHRARLEKARLEAPAKLEAQLESLRDSGFKNPADVSTSQYYLYDRMRNLDGNKSSRWSIGNWRDLEPEFGPRTPRAFRDGMVSFWRRYTPKLASEGAVQGTTPLADLFGLAGLTIEAAEDPALPWRLTAAEAAVAFRYAMQELNGFPPWFAALSSAHPDVVKSMALTEVAFELQSDEEGAPSQYLIYDLSRVGDWLWDSIAPDILKLLRTHPPKGIARLQHMVDIVLASNLPDASLAALAAEKLAAGGDPSQVALWAAVWTGVDPGAAIDALEDHLAALDESKKRTVFMMTYVTYLLGRQHMESRVRKAFRTPSVLMRLYILVHEHVRSSEDIARANKGAYSPGLRDNAQDARERLVNILGEIPGRDAYLGLKEIAERHPEPNVRPWFMLRARSKAEVDSERPLWTAMQVSEFDTEYERMPANHRELFDLAVLRLLDYKHHLEDGNDSTASVVIKAERETVLRNLIGAWCNDRARGRYVIPQELELPDAKRPDLWWTCTAFSGPVPTELKIADNWSGSELFERLENQLAGDYLRDRASVRGIYLLVWRGVQRRWQLPNKKWINFPGLVQALQDHWASVTSAHSCVEEIKVIGIDLTKRAIAPAPAKKAPPKKVLTKKASAKKTLTK
ncbi:MAG: hypothetical protein KKC79_08345 [Gammaproteobacteria bacterium]|nr:hypothetical protein [Gammaproteobacteria bacterium]MBU1440983.1 hypothetical protein [Gammaproteobacteria bacterium]MBU2287535.1 hypothetical protein [Gammaproteobacteria bacterium]MBU2408643.1 hypothetical protein [Gammaproteobacteria bacterium]